MKKLSIVLLTTLSTISLIMASNASNFTLTGDSGNGITMEFQNSYEISQENLGHKIEAENSGKSGLAGVPDLPLFTTFFKMEPGIAYEVSYEVLQSSVIPGIELLESKGLLEDNDEGLEVISQVYNSHLVYPIQNIQLSEPMVMRDMELAMIEFIPFRYNPNTDELTVYEYVEISISENGVRDTGVVRDLPPSQVFESLYESMVINYSREDRVEEYQQPSILYICGGNSLSHPLFQQLLEWRRQSGYIVYTADIDETGSSNSQIKNYITDAYESLDPAPEYVALVGDTDQSYAIPTFYENWSGYNGEGDMPYSQLDGNDLLPEVLVGRLSVDNSTQLSVVVAKTLGYEKATYIDETGSDWYVSAALVGDPSSSGLSTINTNQYIENMLDSWGFEDIMTNYGGSNYNNWMNNALGAGIGYFNYRGYIGVSGFNGGDGANNGWMTPFVTFLTCSTGSFGSSWGESIIENMFRSGTVSNPGGGVACIGTATSGTHTAFNNIVEMGIYEGIFPKELETGGAALGMGKLALLLAYPTDPSNKTSIFSHWNNLMGDPALQLWTLRPAEFIVVHSEYLASGSNVVEVIVGDEDGIPVENARVVFLDDNDESIYRFTDEEGRVLIPIETDYDGDMSVVVRKRNFIPYEGEIEFNNSGAVLNAMVNELSITDQNGNSDNVINPGEIITFSFPVANNGNGDLVDLVVSLNADNDLVSILSGSDTVESLLIGENTDVEFEFALSTSAVYMEELNLTVDFSDSDGNTWFSAIPAMVSGSRLSIESFGSTSGGLIQPGEDVDFEIYLKNEGDLPSGNITVILSEFGPWDYLDIDDVISNFDPINSGETGLSLDGFHLITSDDVVHGTMLQIQVDITDDLGYNRTEFLMLQVGEVSVTDPLGPDPHGYYIYDSGDLGYSLALPYSWYEIDPSIGGDGTSLGLNDQGYGNPASQTPAHLDLPFTFTFYGVDYDEITISSNGYIALGNSQMSSFRNYVLPGAGGPSPMIAAFWDDLKTTSGGGVYSFVDEENGEVVIEWSGIHTYEPTSTESFQVILIDAITPTGDDEILIQYKEFNNTTSGNMNSGCVIHGDYSTIGIENHLGNMGLQYSFNNQYPVAAMPLEDETAIFITTRQPTSLLKGDVNIDGELNVLDIVMLVNDLINLEELGPLESYIADMNEDSILNVLDVILLINDILG